MFNVLNNLFYRLAAEMYMTEQYAAISVKTKRKPIDTFEIDSDKNKTL